jgi:hypothetical protein
MPWPQANQVVKGALISIGEERQDPNLAEVMARSIKTKDGFTLWDHADVQEEIKQSQRNIFAQQTEMLKNQQLRQQITDTQSFKPIADQAYQAYASAGFPAGKTVFDFADKDALGKLDSKAAQEALGEMTSLTAQAQAGSQFDYSKTFLGAIANNYGTDHNSLRAFAAQAAKATADGHPELAAQAESQRNLYWQSLGGVTDAGTKGNLFDAYLSRTLTPQMAADAYHNGKLSATDYGQFIGLIGRNDDHIPAIMDDMSGKIMNQILSEYGADSPEHLRLVPGAQMELMNRIHQAKSNFFSQLPGLLADKTLPLMQQYQKLDEMGDNIVQKLGKPIPAKAPPATGTPLPQRPSEPINDPLAASDNTVQAGRSILSDPDLRKALNYIGVSPSSISYGPESNGTIQKFINGMLADDDGDEIRHKLSSLSRLRSQSQPDYDAENEVVNNIQHLDNGQIAQRAHDAAQSIPGIIDNFRYNGSINSQDRNTLVSGLSAIEAHAYLLSHIPQKVSDVQGNPDAWKQAPLYATPKQLMSNIKTDMPTFGLDPNNAAQYKLYRDTQLRLNQQMRQ